MELLVVVALIAVLVGMLLPAVQKIREATHRAACLNNIRQLSVASHNCHTTHSKLPPMVGNFPDSSEAGDYGNVFFFLLPFLDQEPLFRMSWNGSIHELDDLANGLYARPVKTFLCPSDPTAPTNGLMDNGWAAGCYGANFLVFGNPGIDWQGEARIPTHFPDGASRTILFAERYARCGAYGSLWARSSEYDDWVPTFAFKVIGPKSVFQSSPTPWQTGCDPSRPSTAHGVGMNVGMADGSARRLARSIDPTTWWGYCTPDGNEVYAED
jgi:hypothetical protein